METIRELCRSLDLPTALFADPYFVVVARSRPMKGIPCEPLLFSSPYSSVPRSTPTPAHASRGTRASASSGANARPSRNRPIPSSRRQSASTCRRPVRAPLAGLVDAFLVSVIAIRPPGKTYQTHKATRSLSSRAIVRWAAIAILRAFFVHCWATLGVPLKSRRSRCLRGDKLRNYVIP